MEKSSKDRKFCIHFIIRYGLEFSFFELLILGLGVLSSISTSIDSLKFVVRNDEKIIKLMETSCKNNKKPLK